LQYSHKKNIANFHYKNRVPFVCYADFEAWNKMYYNESKAKINRVPELDYTQQAFCYGIQILSGYPNLVKSVYLDYYGENTVDHFVQTIIKLEKK